MTRIQLPRWRRRETSRPGPIPDLVRLADDQVRAMVAGAPEGVPVIGLTEGAAPVGVGLDVDPHVLISGRAGCGLSVVLRTLVAQLMYDGATVSVIDLRRHSHRWLRGLPGVDYWTLTPEIHDGLVELGRMAERRNAAVGESDETDDDSPRHVVVVEEANATIARLQRHWRSIRRPGQDPQRSPALDALDDVLFMGRGVKMHVFAVSSVPSARALGADARAQFGVGIVAGGTTSQFRLLAPDAAVRPLSRKPGRVTVVFDGRPVDVQVVLFKEHEATAWATGSAVVDAAGERA